METVQKGDEMYHGVVLEILKTIFEVQAHENFFLTDLQSSRNFHCGAEISKSNAVVSLTPLLWGK